VTSKTPTTPLAPVTEFDWKGYIAGARFALDRKFEASDIDADPLLISCAKFYLASDLPEKISHVGVKQFVSDVAYKSRRYGLSAGQVKGVLNVAVGQVTAREGQMEAASSWDGKQVIENGIYTLVLDGLAPEDSKEWVTLQVQDDWRDNAVANAQSISVLVGPDNTRNYRGFAFLTGDTVKMYSKQSHQTQWQEYAGMLLDLAKGDPLVREAREAYAMISGRCSRCHKTLTVPKSVEYGVGPECRKILGID
jgi:hypothetical protein